MHDKDFLRYYPLNQRANQKAKLRFVTSSKESYGSTAAPRFATMSKAKSVPKKHSANRRRGIFIIALVIFLVGFASGFPVGRILLLDRSVVRYPDTIDSPSSNPVVSTKPVKATNPATKTQPEQNVQFTNLGSDSAYIIHVGNYVKKDAVFVKQGLQKLITTQETDKCPKYSNATWPILITNDQSNANQAQVYVGCFIDIERAQSAVTKIKPFAPELRIFRLQN